MIDIEVNGKHQQIAANSSVSDLIAALGLEGQAVAVERNQHVVPRNLHRQTTLEPGDRVELVRFVGGG